MTVPVALVIVGLLLTLLTYGVLHVIGVIILVVAAVVLLVDLLSARRVP